MKGSKGHDAQVHAEIKDLKQLGFGESQHDDPNQFGQSDAAQHLVVRETRSKSQHGHTKHSSFNNSAVMPTSSHNIFRLYIYKSLKFSSPQKFSITGLNNKKKIFKNLCKSERFFAMLLYETKSCHNPSQLSPP